MINGITKTCVIIFAAIILFTQGCKKESTGDNVKFIGTYNGTEALDLNNGGPTYYGSIRVLASGVNANQIVISDSIYNITFTATVSGNNITSISGSTLSFNGCSNETYTGNGALTDNILTYSLYGAYFCNSTNNYDTLQFYGTRP